MKMKPTVEKLQMRREKSGSSGKALALADVIRVDEEARRVDARTLHKWLGAKTDFSHWARRRIADCRLTQDSDFIVVKNDVNDFKEFWFTLDAAKMISMIERTDRGDQARRYFVQVEQRFIRLQEEALPKLKAALETAIGERDQAQALLKQVTTPKVIRRRGKVYVRAFEKIRLTDIFGLESERLVAVSRPFDELSDAQREEWRIKHRQATLSGLSRAQERGISKVVMIPTAKLPASNNPRLKDPSP